MIALDLEEPATLRWEGETGSMKKRRERVEELYSLISNSVSLVYLLENVCLSLSIHTNECIFPKYPGIIIKKYLHD